MNGPLYRTRDRMLAGVAGGVADYFDVDPSLVRVLWAVSFLFGGITLVLYIVMAIVVPEEPDTWPANSSFGASVGGTAPAGQAPAAPGEQGAGSPEGLGVPPIAPQPAGPASGYSGLGPSSWRTQRQADREARRAARWARRQERWDRHGYDPGSGAIVFGILLILLGSAFLARQLVPDLDWGQIWPVVLIAGGVVLLVGSVTRRAP